MACQCPDWLCEAWESLAKHSPVPTEEIAELMGLSESELRCYGYKRDNRNEHHRCAPQWRIAQAARLSGNPVVVNAISQHSGLTTPKRRKPSGQSANHILGLELQKIGEVLKAMGAAISERPPALIPDDHHKIQGPNRNLRMACDDLDTTIGHGRQRRQARGT